MGKRFLFSCLAILSFILTSFAQTGNTIRYDLPLSTVKLIEPSPDGGYYFCGERPYNVILGKVDSVGNLQWAREIGVDTILEFPNDIAILNNGNVVACLQSYDGSTLKTYLISFDQAGNLVFCKKYLNAVSGMHNTPNNIIKDGDGFSVAVYNFPIDEVRIIKADSLGNKIASTYFWGNTRYIFKTATGNYLLYNPFSTEVISMDGAFNYLNSAYTYTMLGSGIFHGIIELSNGSFLLFGESDMIGGILTKFNSQLEIEWQKFYDFDFLSQSGKFGAAQKIDTNRIVFFGQGDIYGRKPYILVTDTLGNVMNCKLISTDGFNAVGYPGRFVFKNDKLTFIYNITTGPSMQTGVCFKIIFTDSSLAQICNAEDTTMIFTEDIIDFSENNAYNPDTISDIFIPDSLPVINITFPYGACNDSTLNVNYVAALETHYDIFPNPFNSEINIVSEHSEISEVFIFDISSRLILHKQFTNRVSLNTFQLDVGIYFYEIKNKIGVYEKGKLIKE